MYSLQQLVRILEREEREVPDKENDDDDEDQYKVLLMEVCSCASVCTGFMIFISNFASLLTQFDWYVLFH